MSAWVARWRWALGGGLLILVAGLVAVAIWPSGGPAAPYRPPLRARAYNAFTMCLLTGPQGVAGASAVPVWAGVEAASEQTADQAEYLAATGSVETVDSVTPFVNSLVQQRCGLIIAVGPVEVQAAQAVAAENKGIKFVLVGGGSKQSNVRIMTDISPSSIASEIAAYAGD